MHDNMKFSMTMGSVNNTCITSELKIKEPDGANELHMTISSRLDADCNTTFLLYGVDSKQLSKLADNLKEMAFSLGKIEAKQLDLLKK